MKEIHESVRILSGYTIKPPMKTFRSMNRNINLTWINCLQLRLREILLVVAVGMELDNAFKASTGLYDCNPRAIYEGPIKEFLIAKEIPHRKSGPLNVAKATVGLDHTWAAQRRPSDVAEKVVALVEYMENDTSRQKTRVTKIATSLLRRLIAESNRMEALSVEIEPSADPDFLYKLCYELITKAPDSGNTPQKIAAYLLKSYHLAMDTGIIVTGEEDRASVTSTTSKKPGDVNEESPNGEIYKIYEITVKQEFVIHMIASASTMRRMIAPITK